MGKKKISVLLIVCFLHFFSPHTVKPKLPFSFTKTADYFRLAANLLSTRPPPHAPDSFLGRNEHIMWGAPTLGPLGFWVSRPQEKASSHHLCSSSKTRRSTRPLPRAIAPTSLSCGWVCPCASSESRGAGGQGGNHSESAPSDPALNTS